MHIKVFMALIIAFITILIRTITLQILCNISEIVNFREKMAYTLGFTISEIDCIYFKIHM